MCEEDDEDESRTLFGAEGLRIFVPYRRDRDVETIGINSHRLESVRIWVGNYDGDYHRGIREGRLRRDDRDYVFSDTELEWLKAQKELVDKMRLDRRPPV